MIPYDSWMRNERDLATKAIGPRLAQGQFKKLKESFDMDVSKNSDTPKSSISIGFSIINHPFRGTPIFGNTHMKGSLGHDSFGFVYVLWSC